MKTTLVEFLKSKNALEKFRANIACHSIKEGESAEDIFCRLEKDNLTISAAFIWKETPEGESFWMALSQQFTALSDEWIPRQKVFNNDPYDARN